MDKKLYSTNLYLQTPQELVNDADRFMLGMLWLHLPLASFIVPYSYGTWRESLLASLFLCLIGTVSYIFLKGTFLHRLLNGILLLSYSIILISAQFGRIEMHFHVFSALPFLLVYKDWRIIPPAGAVVIIHHSVFNYCQSNDIDFFGFPLIVFNYGSGWDIVFLHFIFVAFECSILIYYSKQLRRQYLDLFNMNKELEKIVDSRTADLRNEIKKIEAYNKALDQFAITELTDNKGVILDVNKNFEKISGFKRSEVVGRSHELIRSGYHSQDFYEQMWKVLEAGEVWRAEMRNITKTGETFWVDTAIAPMKNEKNEIEQYIAVRFDITSRKKNEELILKQRAQMVSQSRLSALGEMAGGIAHEINNPLSIISTSMGSMKKMIAKNMVKTQLFTELIEDIEHTIVRITRIISGLRNISREATRENYDTCQIEEILTDVLSVCAEKFKSNGVEFNVKLDSESKNKNFKAMRVQLSQVILNLLSNAYDAIAQANEKWINLVITSSDEYLMIKCIDSGPGISEEIQNKIFQPFFTTKEIGKGTGLGLSLSLEIVKRHEGKFFLDIDSPNTCFVIMIPLLCNQEEKQAS